MAILCAVMPAADAWAQTVPDIAARAGEALTLDAALQAATSGNIDLLNARLAVQSARANLRSADTAPNPVFSVNAVQIRPSQVGRLPFSRYADAVARVDLPLERGGKRTARVAAARASVTAAESDLADAQRQMRAAVANAFFALKAAEQRVAALETIARDYGESIRIATTQRRAGALSEGDLVRQRVDALSAQGDAQQAASDLRDAQIALAILIGREADAAALSTAGDWPVRGEGPEEPAEAIAARRPDVRADQARVEAARRNLDGAHALRHPDVTVGVQAERAAGDLGVGNSLGFGVSIPLPVRNLYRGEIDAASTALVQAEAQARKSLAVAVAEIETARRQLAQASDRLTLIEGTQLPAARRASDIAEFAYGHGAMTLLDVLDARRSLKAVELSVIDARAAQAQAIARLRAAETTGTN
ncbi:TolC family protein [Sphingomonas metalli]|nr:TolC family protein [Sphingomonas metalli]